MMFKKFHANRLLKLASHLESLPRKVFSIEVWHQTKSCGTVACAAGHACMMPEFRRAGFRLTEDGWPIYRGEEHFHACSKFFGITVDESLELFSPNYYKNSPTPKQVAKRIRTLVAKKVADATKEAA